MTSNHFSGRCDEPDSLRDPIAESPQLQITRLAMKLAKSEARELIEDLFQRHLGLRQELTQSETEVRK